VSAPVSNTLPDRAILFGSCLATPSDAAGFLIGLHRLGLQLLPGDDPFDAIDFESGRRCLNDFEALSVSQRMNEVLALMDDVDAFVEAMDLADDALKVLSPGAAIVSHQMVDTGGGIEVRLFSLLDGRILGVTDECAVIYPTIEHFRDGSYCAPDAHCLYF
jgi:hypothetical protein